MAILDDPIDPPVAARDKTRTRRGDPVTGKGTSFEDAALSALQTALMPSPDPGGSAPGIDREVQAVGGGPGFLADVETGGLNLFRRARDAVGAARRLFSGGEDAASARRALESGRSSGSSFLESARSSSTLADAPPREQPTPLQVLEQSEGQNPFRSSGYDFDVTMRQAEREVFPQTSTHRPAESAPPPQSNVAATPPHMSSGRSDPSVPMGTRSEAMPSPLDPLGQAGDPGEAMRRFFTLDRSRRSKQLRLEESVEEEFPDDVTEPINQVLEENNPQSAEEAIALIAEQANDSFRTLNRRAQSVARRGASRTFGGTNVEETQGELTRTAEKMKQKSEEGAVPELRSLRLAEKPEDVRKDLFGALRKLEGEEARLGPFNLSKDSAPFLMSVLKRSNAKAMRQGKGLQFEMEPEKGIRKSTFNDLGSKPEENIGNPMTEAEATEKTKSQVESLLEQGFFPEEMESTVRQKLQNLSPGETLQFGIKKNFGVGPLIGTGLAAGAASDE